METTRYCPGCRKPLAADAPQGLCPECLLKAALDPASNAPTGAAAAPAGTEISPSLEEVGKLFPGLEVLEVLGQGGMGVVYKARQKQLDRFVALKIMLPQFSRDPSFVERFNREARALAKLNHPNIVAVYDFGQAALPTASQTPDARAHSQLCFFLMEFVDGANLRSVIHSGKLTSTEALAIVPKLCDALQFAHDEGVVHRDIKPANILVDRKGRVKIADFGLAKLAGTQDLSLTRSQQGMGTPQYMAPEQLENAKSVDHRADIYSLGVVFYEMLTGELPLGRFALPSHKVHVDVRLDEIVLKALEHEPARRYQHASEVRTQVEGVTGSPMVAPTPPPALAVDTPPDDFIICNPRLPRMAQAITAFALIIAPLFYLVDVFTLGDLPKNAYAAFVESVMNLALVIGGFVATTMLFIGGIKLRKLSPDGPGYLVGGFYVSIIGVLLVCSSLAVWSAELQGATGNPSVMGYGEALVSAMSLMVLAFEIAALVWLHRNRQRLAVMCGPAAASPKAGRQMPMEPRFSRAAIVGAVWALFGLLSVVPILFFIGLIRVWNGTAQPTDLIHEAPPAVFTAFMGVLLALGSGAPIGTTVLGLVSLANIRRSGGKLLGLPLAFADAACFPLLAFGGLIAFIAAQMWTGLAPHPKAASVVAATSFGIVIALGVCLLIIRALWIKLVGGKASAAGKAREPQAQSQGPRLSRLAVWGVVCATIGLVADAVIFVLISNVAYYLGLVQVGEPDIPARFRPVLMACLPFGLVLPVAGTILGWRALGEIRREPQRHSGRGLALFAALLFPLLLLDGAVAGMFDGLVSFIGSLWQWNYETKSGLWALLSLPACGALDYWWVMKVWRQQGEAVEPPPAPQLSLDHRLSEVFTVGLSTWFTRRAPWLQNLIQLSLLLVFTFAFVAFISFKVEQGLGAPQGEAPARSYTHIHIGNPGPWLTADFGRATSGIFVHWSASSLWLGLLGVAAAVLYSRFHRLQPGFDPTAERRQRTWWIVLALVLWIVTIGLFAWMFVNGARTLEQAPVGSGVVKSHSAQPPSVK